MKYIRFFEDLRIKDVPIVGGKNASLGEMLCSLKRKGIRVPLGFATTAEAYFYYLEANHLTDKVFSKKGKNIRTRIRRINR